MEKVKVFCPRCEGKRKILMKKYPEGKGMAWVVCPDCKGEGWIEVELIENAGGRVFFG